VARGSYQETLEGYQRSLHAEPGDKRTKTMLAFMYLRLNLYRGAIGPLEEALAGVVGERNLSPVLALAYAGAGDEGNAVRVLRATAGLTEDLVADEMVKIRKEVSERRCTMSLTSQLSVHQPSACRSAGHSKEPLSGGAQLQPGILRRTAPRGLPPTR
jgi:hypothetical protein